MKQNLTTETDPLIDAVVETLLQGEALLAEISDEAYSRATPVALNACIGGHYRHCLDHFRSLLEAAPGGALDYDLRERGTLVETDRFAALNATRQLREGYGKLDPALLSRSLDVTCKTRFAGAQSQTAPSTVGREIMYAVAHAVHHYALIAIIGAVAGVKMPADFGVAPSTLRHQAQTAKNAAPTS